MGPAHHPVRSCGPLPRSPSIRLALVFRRLLPAFLGLAVAARTTTLRAQEDAPSEFGVRRWTTAEGLPSHYIPRLTQGVDGALWLQTGGSPTRFDGFTFEPTRPRARTGSLGLIMGFTTGVTDTVWVVTSAGQVARLDGDHYVVVDSVGQDLRSVAQTPDRRLWLASFDTLWVRDERGLHVLDTREHADYEQLRPVLVWGDPAGHAWALAGPGTVVRRIDGDGREVLPQATGSIVPDAVRGVVGTRFTDRRVEVIDGRKRILWTIPRREDIRPLLVDREDRLWVAVDGALLVYDNQGSRPHRVDLGDPSARVLSLLEDRGGSFWAGTNEHGLFRIQQQPFRVYRTPGVNGAVQMSTLSRGADGSVLGTDALGGVTRFTADGAQAVIPANPERARSNPYDVVTAYEDREGTLWISGTRGQDAVLVGRRPGRPDRTIVVPGRIYRIREDPDEDGVLWGAYGGLVRLDAHAPAARPEVVVSEEWAVRDLAFAPDGGIWVAGLNGVVRLGPSGREEFPAAEGYPVTSARSVYVDPTGDVWIGTYRLGLVRVHGRRFQTLTTAQGLFENVASAVLPDDQGNLWMAGNGSVHRVSIAEADEVLDGGAARVMGVGYTRRDGLANPETSGWSAYRDPEGRLWFPTFDGAAMVDPPVALRLASDPPDVQLRSVRVNGEPISTADPLELSPRERSVQITWAGLFLRDPEGLRYEVRLQPADAGWQDVAWTRSINYASLSPGEYHFAVRAITTAGVVSPTPATFTFSVTPRFTETLWFPITALLALSGLAVLAWRARVRTMRAQATTLVRLVDERTAALQEEKRLTEAQAERLRTLDEARSRFFANLSHELRTPLTLILGPLEEMTGGGATLTDAPRADVALASARRLNTLVDQLLDVARLESGRLELHRRPIDAAAFVRSLVDACAPLARHRDVDLSVDVGDQAIPVSLDPDEADKVILNLVSNALKFTPSGGHVSVRARRLQERDGAVFQVTVADDGPGIPAEDLERIFQRFQQATDAGAINRGMGLGLALSSDIVALHGGTLTAASTPGAGSVFTLTLPAEAPDAPLHPVVPGRSLEPWLEPWSDDTDEAREDEDATTVLLVEDNAELRAWMRRHLAREYRVVEVGEGLQGLEEARRVIPDVLITDVMMPGMSGEELCRAVKEDPELSFVPVVLVTARGAREHRLSGLEGGADDYVVKPFDIEELLLRVRNLVTSRHRIRERYARENLELPELPSLAAPGDSDAESSAFLDELRRAVLPNLGDEDLSVDGVAAALSMSRSTLYRRVETLLNASPMDLVWRVRLEQAAQWLRDTDASVGEIAYGVGFKSVPHFSRRFKEQFGTTPSAYRRDA